MNRGVNVSFYENKKVLVTGAHGFLGKHLCHRLLNLGAEVNMPTSYTYDLTNLSHVENMVLHFDKIDVLFHLAAHVGGIAYNQANPACLFYDNLTMGANLINLLGRGWEVEKSVFVGSVCSYPLHVPVPTSEEHLGQGDPEPTNGAYGWAKLAVGKMLQAYHEQHGIKAAWPILANLYGPADKFDPERSHVIPALIKKFVDAKLQNAPEVIVWGSGRATRDFLYVDDAVDGILACGEKLDKPDPINIAGGEQTSILYLVRQIQELVGYDGEVVFDTSKPEGQPKRCWQIWKSKHYLDWKPKTTMQAGLKATVEWYLENKVKWA
jgi:GDP-L-fucose synthase